MLRAVRVSVIAVTEFLAAFSAVFRVTRYIGLELSIQGSCLFGSLTDRVTLDALLGRTVSLSASSVLCYPAANYTYVITWRSRDFLEVLYTQHFIL